MPRGLSTAVKSYTGPMVWLADITTRGGAQHYFAEDSVTFGGITYQPYLRLLSGPRLTRTLQADAAEIELINADLVVGNLLQTEDFEGALCELKQLLLGLDQGVTLFRGRLLEQEERDQAVAFRLVSELDPAQLQVHSRDYAQLCTWRFRKKPCGYLEDQISFSTTLGETTADIFSAATIGNSTLSQTVDQHKDQVAVITEGTGIGQKRRVKSNTATTLTLYHQWDTTPDATSKFMVFTFTNGAPKLLLEGTVNSFEKTATSGTARSLTRTGMTMNADEHKDDTLRIVSGTGAGQQRKIKTNDATTLTIAAAEPDLSPAPDNTSKFRVLYRSCPKDFAPSCEERARTEAFNGFPTLVPISRRIFLPPGLPIPFPRPLGPGFAPPIVI